MTNERPLFTNVRIGPKSAANRFVFNSMECNDADKYGDPSKITVERYRNWMAGNPGALFLEAISVLDESRGRVNQLIGSRENLPALAKLIREMRTVNPKPLIIMQLTHSGELSNPEFSRRVCVKPLPGLGGELLSEEEVSSIIEKVVQSAKIARDAGADGVDMKLCHGYLGSQFLRPYNDRKWKYGGAFENRTRFAYEIYERISKEIPDPGFLVGSKISAYEGFPGGCGTAGPDSPVGDLTETLSLVRGLEARGAKYIVESAGNSTVANSLILPGRNSPETAYLHMSFQSALRKALKPQTTVIGSGYSVFRNGKNKLLAVNREESSLEYWGNKSVRDGVCDMIAVGRQALADPLLPIKLEERKGNEVNWCTLCDNCTELLIHQQPVGCCTYQKEYTRRLKEIRRKI